MDIKNPTSTTKEKRLTIGWIGCGVMGRWMCHHILRGVKDCEVFVYSRTLEKCQPLIDEGALPAPSSRFIATRCDVIFSMVGFPQDLEAVIYEEEGGILPGIKERTLPPPIFIDMSTSRPSMAIDIYNLMKTYGVASLDAPVSGGDIGAREGRLSIMVGGDETAFGTVREILGYMGDDKKGGKVVYIGKAGDGQHTKMTNQILIALGMIGACEALVYAHRCKLDISRVLLSISSGAAGSWTLSNLVPRMLNRDFEPGFYVEHFVKDMEIILDECRRMSICLPGLSLAHQMYISLKSFGKGRNGTQALLLTLEKLNNLEEGN